MNRYRDNEELRYSLRSIIKYAPWVRRIFIATDNQLPSWLKVDHPRITVVPHSEFFPDPSTLPTFSSPAIEVNLHRIKGLSRRFVYFNDDVMLGAPIYPDDFMTKGQGVKYYTAWPVPKCDNACNQYWLGDGTCDLSCNISQCHYDAGDCLMGNATKMRNSWQANTHTIPTTHTTTTYTPWTPPAPGAAKPTAHTLAPSTHERKMRYCSDECPAVWIGDGFCDDRCDDARCGHDGGDCATITAAAVNGTAAVSVLPDWGGAVVRVRAEDVFGGNTSTRAVNYDPSAGLEMSPSSSGGSNSNSVSNETNGTNGSHGNVTNGTNSNSSFIATSNATTNASSNATTVRAAADPPVTVVPLGHHHLLFDEHTASIRVDLTEVFAQWARPLQGKILNVSVRAEVPLPDGAGAGLLDLVLSAALRPNITSAAEHAMPKDVSFAALDGVATQLVIAVKAPSYTTYEGAPPAWVSGRPFRGGMVTLLANITTADSAETLQVSATFGVFFAMPRDVPRLWSPPRPPPPPSPAPPLSPSPSSSPSPGPAPAPVVVLAASTTTNDDVATRRFQMAEALHNTTTNVNDTTTPPPTLAVVSVDAAPSPTADGRYWVSTGRGTGHWVTPVVPMVVEALPLPATLRPFPIRDLTTWLSRRSCAFTGPYEARFIRGHVDGVHREFDTLDVAKAFCLSKDDCNGITRSSFGTRKYEPRSHRKLEKSPTGSLEVSFRKECHGDEDVGAAIAKKQAVLEEKRAESSTKKDLLRADIKVAQLLVDQTNTTAAGLDVFARRINATEGGADADVLHLITHKRESLRQLQDTIDAKTVEIKDEDARLTREVDKILDDIKDLNETHTVSPGRRPLRRPLRRRRRRLLDTYGDTLVHVDLMYKKAFGKDAGGAGQNKVPAHMPHMIDSVEMENLQTQFKPEFVGTAGRKFRNSRDMQYAFAYFQYIRQHRAAWDLRKIWSVWVDTNHDGVLDGNEMLSLTALVHNSAPTDSQVKEVRACLLDPPKPKVAITVTTSTAAVPGVEGGTNTTGGNRSNATVNATGGNATSSGASNTTTSATAVVLGPACISWRQTGGCTPEGPRESQFDRTCNQIISTGASGYCECRDGMRTRESTCKHSSFTCDDSCTEMIDDARVDAEQEAMVAAAMKALDGCDLTGLFWTPAANAANAANAAALLEGNGTSRNSSSNRSSSGGESGSESERGSGSGSRIGSGSEGSGGSGGSEAGSEAGSESGGGVTDVETRRMWEAWAKANGVAGGAGAGVRRRQHPGKCNETLFVTLNHTLSVAGLGVSGSERRRLRKAAADVRHAARIEKERKDLLAMPKGAELVRLMTNVSVSFEALEACTWIVDKLKEHLDVAPPMQDVDTERTDEFVSFNMVGDDYEDMRGKLNKVRGLGAKRAKFICVNDDMKHPSAAVRGMLADFYQAMYPLPSPFEHPPGVVNTELRVDEWRRMTAWRATRDAVLWGAAVVLLAAAVVYAYWRYWRGHGRRRDSYTMR
jgi:hypothetical protein